MKKAWFKSKTIIFNGLVLTFGVLETADLSSILPDKYASLVLLAATVINIWLRLITSSAIGADEPGEGFADPERGQ